jgi:nitroimidazol reductase NimA-like FMN-containing flavoprotein (pyridoxamine 5'-phosphate oxidase superfamily)
MFISDGAFALNEAECHDRLATATVGRVSVTIRALPIIVPVSYGYLGGSVILSMANGPAQRAVALGHVIALGVDNANLDEAQWAILIIGQATAITDPTARTEYQRLGLTAHADSATAASHYLQLRPDIISGYRTTSPW